MGHRADVARRLLPQLADVEQRRAAAGRARWGPRSELAAGAVRGVLPVGGAGLACGVRAPAVPWGVLKKTCPRNHFLGGMV